MNKAQVRKIVEARRKAAKSKAVKVEAPKVVAQPEVKDK